jgi:hypothetical protein
VEALEPCVVALFEQERGEREVVALIIAGVQLLQIPVLGNGLFHLEQPVRNGGRELRLRRRSSRPTVDRQRCIYLQA